MVLKTVPLVLVLVVVVCNYFQNLTRAAIIGTECTDVTTNKTYKLGEGWDSADCERVVCKATKVVAAGDREFPAPVKEVCAEIDYPNQDARNCYRVNKTEEKFPDCCPQMVCFKDNQILAIKSKEPDDISKQ